MAMAMTMVMAVAVPVTGSHVTGCHVLTEGLGPLCVLGIDGYKADKNVTDTRNLEPAWLLALENV